MLYAPDGAERLFPGLEFLDRQIVAAARVFQAQDACAHGGDDLGDGAPSAAGEAPPSMLPAVQKKLRERSKGKFYSDGWSTSQSKVSYILVAVVMLLVIAICYFAMGPVGVSH